MSNPLHLQLPQIELALKFLANDHQSHPPEELKHLKLHQWDLLYQLLQRLEQEKQSSPLH